MICPICGGRLDPRADDGEVIRPGPAWAPVHVPCFAAWDAADESDSLSSTYEAAIVGEPAQEVS